MIRIIPIETGKARMKTAQMIGRDGRGGVGTTGSAKVQPIVDTGDTWRNSVPGYLPWWNPFFTKQVQIKVAPLEEIGPRLAAMNIDPARDIAAVILTHFHHDHTGGLDHFPHNRIIASRESYEASVGLKGKMMGCLPQRWPIFGLNTWPRMMSKDVNQFRIEARSQSSWQFAKQIFSQIGYEAVRGRGQEPDGNAYAVG
jgi:beta-lactamase superfamily II metal-dependent hydrolase